MKVVLVLIFATMMVSLEAAKKEIIRTERAEAVRHNPKLVNEFLVHTFKYNRTTTALNITLNLKITIRNESKAVVQVYKFSSNEYRSFPMVFDAPICASFADNYFGMQNLASCGNFTIACPISAGNYHIGNWIPDDSKFPPHLIPGRFKANFRFMYGSHEMFVADWYVEIKDEWVRWA